MVAPAQFDEDTACLLPPPRKLLRRGTPELEDAVENGEVELSLPQHQVTSWMGHTQGCKQVPALTIEEESGARTSCTAAGQTTNHASEEETATRQDLQRKMQRSATTVTTKFSDIIGHGHVKLRLEEVLLPLALPQQLADSILIGVRANTASILMYGPPGCGKTQLAKAVAGEAEAAFLSVGPSDILSKFVGESEASIRSLFTRAREQALMVPSKCAVLFFDEIDALGQSRGGNGTSDSERGGDDGCSRRVLAELLIQLNRIDSFDESIHKELTTASIADGFVATATASLEPIYKDEEQACGKSVEGDSNGRTRIIVVAATNRPEDCDPALVRRFSVRVVVGLPHLRERKKIIKRYLEDIESSISKEQLQEIAAATDGWSGSDLESLTREATMAPVRECIRSAALLRRRRPNRQQHRGLSSCQDDNASANSGSYEEEKKLLEQFRNLRQVTVADFREAIAFWTLNHNPNAHSEGDNDGERPLVHYDSSSDEDD
eukprot:scaffold2243_cov122-Cylindrotheca_fusiformis.AAC.29